MHQLVTGEARQVFAGPDWLIFFTKICIPLRRRAPPRRCSPRSFGAQPRKKGLRELTSRSSTWPAMTRPQDDRCLQVDKDLYSTAEIRAVPLATGDMLPPAIEVD